MYLHIQNLLNEEQLSVIDELLADAPYVDGSSTAGVDGQSQKNNLQLDRDAFTKTEELDRIVVEALSANATLRSGTLPHRILAPTYNKYDVGMGYGPHSDNPVMGVPQAIRTDMSVTIFLSSPDSYEGGELVVKTEAGEATVKPPRGDAIVYETGQLHMVREVTEGTRLAAVTWIQSVIADPRQRQTVYELDAVCQSLRQKMPDSEELRVLTKTYGNLVRMWGQM